MDRRKGIVSSVALTSFLFCGFTAPQQCSQPKTHGTAIAVTAIAAVAVGTVVVIAIHSSHHNIKGCAYTDKDGLHIQDSNSTKKYVLAGVTPDIKPGDTVSLHGSKARNTKDSSGNETFVVEKVKKDYGLCSAQPPVNAAP